MNIQTYLNEKGLSNKNLILVRAYLRRKQKSPEQDEYEPEQNEYEPEQNEPEQQDTQTKDLFKGIFYALLLVIGIPFLIALIIGLI